MIFFHDWRVIKDYLIAVTYPETTGAPTETTLAAMGFDLWDYHLDHRRWWEQTHKHKYHRIKTKITQSIPGQHKYSYDALLDHDYHDNAVIGHDTVWLFTQTTPFTGQDPVDPPDALHSTLYIDVQWGYRDEFGGFTPESHIDHFFVPLPEEITPSSTVTEDTINNFKVARLNYLTDVDLDVIREAEMPSTGSDEFKHKLSQAVSGVAFIPQANPNTLWITGYTIYLFPGRTDIKPFVSRPFNDTDTVRDWRVGGQGDQFGLWMPGEPGFGSTNFNASHPNFHSGYPFLLTNGLSVDKWNGIPNETVSQNEVTVYDDGITVRLSVNQNVYGIAEFLKKEVIFEVDTS